MSWPYLHTLINHFPIVLTVIGAIAVLFASLIERRAIWVYSLSCLVLAGVTVYPAWASGHRAAGMVRKAWYIAPGVIRTHSSSADVTLWIVGVTALIALIALITLARTPQALSPAKGFRILVGLGALASIAAVSYTGYLGGRIVVESPILMAPTPPPALDSLGNPLVTTPTGAPATIPNQMVPPAANPANPATGAPAQPQIPPATQQQPPAQVQPQPQKPQTQMTVPVTQPRPQTA
ncbi:MAG: hypothetical protein ABI026_03420 [Gemmatimonadaceae bacterium]